jgi:hypothetical protein
MIETAISGLYVDAVAEGMHRQIWREPQLALIQKQLQQINLPPLLAESLRVERSGLLRIIESEQTIFVADYVVRNSSKKLLGLISHKSWLPRGWLEQNCVVVANLEQTLIESLDVTNHLVLRAKTRLFSDELNRISLGFRPQTFFAALLLPDFTRAVQSLAFQQVRVDEAQVACALEHYRLTTGGFPETLEALCPRYLEKVPHDIIGGQDLKYRREGNTHFVLYSVGWNGTDEQGTARLSENGMSDISGQDWVWQSPKADGRKQLTAN